MAFDRQYSYNGANQISQIAEVAQTRNFGYDVVDRLTSVSGSVSESYAFDGVGNRNTSHRSASYSYQPNNKLTSTNTATYAYNANGNMTSKTDVNGTTQFIWDTENRLKQVIKPDTTSVTYKYDSLGRRSESSLSTGTWTKFTYDGPDVMLDQNSDATTVPYMNGLGIDNKIRQTVGGQVQYFLKDHLGSTNALTNATGAVLTSASYDSFGNATGTLTTRYQYTGREFDSFTGLLYSRARFYDSNLGRFISEDPIGFAGEDVNLYAYVQNQPVSSSDPLGLWPFRPPQNFPTRGNLPGTGIPYRMDMRQEPFPNMHVYWPDNTQTVITHKGGWDPNHSGAAPPPRSYRQNLKPVSDNFLCRVKLKFPGGFGGVFFAITFADGAFDDYDRWGNAGINSRTFGEQMCDDYSDAGPYINTAIGLLPNPYQGCKGT